MANSELNTIEVDLSNLDLDAEERKLLNEKIREAIQEVIKARAQPGRVRVVASRPGWIGIER